MYAVAIRGKGMFGSVGQFGASAVRLYTDPNPKS